MIKLLLLAFFISTFVNAQNGIIKTYFQTGKVESRVSFVKEILEGTSFWYYENGNLKKEKNYSNGKLTGISRNYYDSGLIKDETHFLDGVLNGIYKSYYNNGGLNEIVNYESGKLISKTKLIFDDLYLAPLSAYEAGRKKGIIEVDDFICAIEVCPEPVDGLNEIESNIVYPVLAKQFGLEGTVLVSTTIDRYGNPKNIKVLKELGLGCTEAAIDAVRKTKFIPGRENGDEVEADVTFGLRFFIKDKVEKKLPIVASSNGIEEITKLPEDSKRDKFIMCELDECPEPIGGITELLSKLRYPPQAKRNNISGDVIVKAKVNDLGFVISAEVIKGIGHGCDEAAKSVIIKTQFVPGKTGNKDVEGIIEITVPFISN